MTGGPGTGNTYWDAGEHVQFKLHLENDGTTPLTGVYATSFFVSTVRRSSAAISFGMSV